jgi:hypothetical protein
MMLFYQTGRGNFFLKRLQSTRYFRLTMHLYLHLEGEHSMQKRLDPSQDALDSYEFTDEDLYELMKRGSLLRFGKRGSLLRFGKRGSLLRFGKRSFVHSKYKYLEAWKTKELNYHLQVLYHCSPCIC